MKKYFPLALIIGRFQPFCKHHLEMIKEVWKNSECQKLLIGIGDSGKIDERNFLKSEEVKEIVDAVLRKTKINYELKIIKDINNPPKYGSHVESIFKEIKENNCQLYTENYYTKDCFINFGHNYKVVCPKILPNKATEIRQMIKTDNLDWKKLVPKEVVEYLVNYGLIKRLKS